MNNLAYAMRLASFIERESEYRLPAELLARALAEVERPIEEGHEEVVLAVSTIGPDVLSIRWQITNESDQQLAASVMHRQATNLGLARLHIPPLKMLDAVVVQCTSPPIHVK